MNRTQSNFGFMKKNKYHNFKNNSKVIKSLYEEDDMSENCSGCYCCDSESTDYSYGDADWDELYESLEKYSDNMLNNVVDNKYVKRIFKKDFLDKIFIEEKVSYNAQSVIIETKLSDINSDCDLINNIFDDKNKYNFNMSINISFSNLEYTNIKSITLHVYNKFGNKDMEEYITNNKIVFENRNFLNFNLLYKHNNRIVLNKINCLNVIKNQCDKKINFDFEKYSLKNEGLILYYFLENNKLIKNKTFNILDTINNEDTFKLFEIYYF